MKKLVCMLLLGISTTTLLAQDFPRLGVGYQANFPASGLSVKYDINETHSIQGVLGFLGVINSYFGRYSYHFPERGDGFAFRPYLFGQVGVYVSDAIPTDIERFLQGADSTDKESILGFGAGGGIDFEIKNFIPNLRFSTDISFAQVDFEFADFNTIAFGIGIHYTFSL